MIDSLSALTAQQAIIIELLAQKLPSISEEERKALGRSAKNNYEIAENLKAAVKKVRGV